MQKPDNLAEFSLGADSGKSASVPPASSSKSSQNRVMCRDTKYGEKKSISRSGNESVGINSFPESTQAGDLFSVTVGDRRLPPVRGCLTATFLLFLYQSKSPLGHCIKSHGPSFIPNQCR